MTTDETLQIKCVKCVASYFDRFCDIFNSTAEDRISKYVKLLQKMYSDQLLVILCNESRLKNCHLKFCLNKYTKHLNLHYLSSCDYSAIEERLQDIGSNITTFSMVGIQKYFNSDNFIQHLSRIEVLELAQTKCSDRSVAIIAENCNTLKSLDLYGCDKVTDKGLLLLCQKKPPLEKLNVEYTSVSFRAVAMVLKTIKTLTRLQFDNVPRAIFEAMGLNESLTNGVTQVFNLTNLVVLNNPMRPENHLTEILNVCTKACPFVENLIVSEIITEGQLQLCSLFESLETVQLQCSTIGSPKLCINEFLQVRGNMCTVLSLTSFSLSVELLANCCPNLKCLNLLSPLFENAPEEMVVFPCLKIFNLQKVCLRTYENRISATCIISSSPNLEELHLVHCLFLEEIEDVILHCPKYLTLLNFSNTIVSPEFIERVLRIHTSLVKIILDNSGIGSSDYDDLMDIVDSMEKNLNIAWADYSEAIRELFYSEDYVMNNRQKRYILKL